MERREGSQGRLFEPQPAGEVSREELAVAWRLARIRQPLDDALANPALAICLRNSALALRKRQQ